MPEEPDSLILRYLRRIDQSVSDLREEVSLVKARIGALEGAVLRLSASEQEHFHTLSMAFDRNEKRLDRVERRLDLTEAAPG